LDVIEEEASNAEEMEIQQSRSTDCQRPQSEVEDVDICSLQQNVAAQDSLSTDKTDAYLDAAAAVAAAEQDMEGPMDVTMTMPTKWPITSNCTAWNVIYDYDEYDKVNMVCTQKF
jgi:hypothetical protein